jgi:hypothetical protein
MWTEMLHQVIGLANNILAGTVSDFPNALEVSIICAA